MADLDALQRALVDALEAGLSPDEVRDAVAKHDPEWARQLDDRAIRVAAKLVRKWTRR